MYSPPLTAIYSPVIKLAASLARNNIAFAMSSAVAVSPQRCLLCHLFSSLGRAEHLMKPRLDKSRYNAVYP